MPTAYCYNTKCSHFRYGQVNMIGGRSFPGRCNVWVHELDENGMCLDITYAKTNLTSRSSRVVDVCEHSGIPGTPCDKDNCNSGCLS